MADPDVEGARLAAMRNPAAWLDQADQLKRAADVLLVGFQNDVGRSISLMDLDGPGPLDLAATDARGDLRAWSLGPSYLMVAGYAIENLAKGLIAAQEADASPHSLTRKHVSRELLSRAGVALSDEESSLVDRMKERVLWAGRYPVPKTPRELERAREGTLWDSVLLISTSDGRLVNSLFARMRSLLAERVPASQQSR